MYGTSVINSLWLSDNIGSVNAFVPWGTKPLDQIMLTQHQICSVAFLWGPGVSPNLTLMADENIYSVSEAETSRYIWQYIPLYASTFNGHFRWIMVFYPGRENAGLPLSRLIMMTSSNGNIFRVTGPLCGEFTGPGEFPAQRSVTRSFDVFFDLRLYKRLSKQSLGWWFETPAWSLWRHRNVNGWIPIVTVTDSHCKSTRIWIGPRQRVTDR